MSASLLLLDTNIWVALLKKKERTIETQFRGLRPDQVFTCSVVKAELLFGARKSAHVAENLRNLAAVFELYRSLPFDDDAASSYAQARFDLERSGRGIGERDLLIASIALAADATVVTRNDREFRRVPGLRVERW